MSTGIVLGGGGGRGAYEAGVLAGIAEITRKKRRGPFDVVCGTSVGAINAAWVGAHADLGGLAIEGLLSQWCSLSLDEHLRLDVRGWIRRARGGDDVHMGRAILDPRELEELVEDGIPWPRLRRNVERGMLRALIVTALHVDSGRTTIFTDLAPGERYPASRDPRRAHSVARITADHVLASAAVPLLFPSRRIGDSFYADGGLRFNTPIAPALRMGVDRLVVVPLLKDLHASDTGTRELYPNAIFLAGKLLNALLLDPIRYDLAVLERFNRLVRVLEETLDDAEMKRVNEAMCKARGAPYRRVETLVFRPTQDLGALARERGRRLAGSGWRGKVLARLTNLSGSVEADLLSFVLFDGEHAADLIALGKADVLARRDEVNAFFADAP